MKFHTAAIFNRFNLNSSGYLEFSVMGCLFFKTGMKWTRWPWQKSGGQGGNGNSSGKLVI